MSSARDDIGDIEDKIKKIIELKNTINEANSLYELPEQERNIIQEFTTAVEKIEDKALIDRLAKLKDTDIDKMSEDEKKQLTADYQLIQDSIKLIDPITNLHVRIDAGVAANVAKNFTLHYKRWIDNAEGTVMVAVGKDNKAEYQSTIDKLNRIKNDLNCYLNTKNKQKQDDNAASLLKAIWKKFNVKTEPSEEDVVAGIAKLENAINILTNGNAAGAVHWGYESVHVNGDAKEIDEEREKFKNKVLSHLQDLERTKTTNGSIQNSSPTSHHTMGFDELSTTDARLIATTTGPTNPGDPKIASISTHRIVNGVQRSDIEFLNHSDKRKLYLPGIHRPLGSLPVSLPIDPTLAHGMKHLLDYISSAKSTTIKTVMSEKDNLLKLLNSGDNEALKKAFHTAPIYITGKVPDNDAEAIAYFANQVGIRWYDTREPGKGINIIRKLDPDGVACYKERFPKIVSTYLHAIPAILATRGDEIKKAAEVIDRCPLTPLKGP